MCYIHLYTNIIPLLIVFSLCLELIDVTHAHLMLICVCLYVVNVLHHLELLHLEK